MWVSKMVQQIKVLDDLSLIPETHMMEEVNLLSKFSSMFTYAHAHTYE